MDPYMDPFRSLYTPFKGDPILGYTDPQGLIFGPVVAAPRFGFRVRSLTLSPTWAPNVDKMIAQKP